MTCLQGGSAPKDIKDVTESKFIVLPWARHTDQPALYIKQHTHTYTHTSKSLWDEPWHGGWGWEEALQGEQRCHSQAGKKGPSLYCLLLPSNFRPSSTVPPQVASTTSEEHISCLCGHLLISLPVNIAALPVSLSHYYDDLDDEATAQTIILVSLKLNTL